MPNKIPFRHDQKITPTNTARQINDLTRAVESLQPGVQVLEQGGPNFYRPWIGIIWQAGTSLAQMDGAPSQRGCGYLVRPALLDAAGTMARLKNDVGLSNLPAADFVCPYQGMPNGLLAATNLAEARQDTHLLLPETSVLVFEVRDFALWNLPRFVFFAPVTVKQVWAKIVTALKPDSVYHYGWQEAFAFSSTVASDPPAYKPTADGHYQAWGGSDGTGLGWAVDDSPNAPEVTIGADSYYLLTYSPVDGYWHFNSGLVLPDLPAHDGKYYGLVVKDGVLSWMEVGGPFACP